MYATADSLSGRMSDAPANTLAGGEVVVGGGSAEGGQR